MISNWRRCSCGGVSGLQLLALRPVAVLRGRLEKDSHGALRKGSVVFQFGIVLVLSTAIAYDQIAFLSSKKLGIEMDQVVVFRNRDIYNDIKGVAREELLAHHAVVAGLKLMDGRRRRVTRVGVTGRSANLPRIWLS